MRINRWPAVRAIGLLLFLLPPGLNAAQPQSSSGQRATPATSVTSANDLAETREQLLALLRMSPTLTDVVASDPTLLTNQDYVNRNNPELGKFLLNHPEVVRNPEFYLFADLPPGPGRRGDRFVRKTWHDESRNQQDPRTSEVIVREFGPPFMMLIVLGTLLWLIRILLQNRRWGRIFKMQTEVHGRLIEKLGNNEELISYMNTEAGKRFLEAAPIPIDFEQDHRIPAALARVLVPLQIGVVLTLLGIGLLALRHSLPDISEPLLVFGILVLMPGIGFIISAGITWLLAARLGLMPLRGAQSLTDSGDRP